MVGRYHCLALGLNRQLLPTVAAAVIARLKALPLQDWGPRMLHSPTTHDPWDAVRLRIVIPDGVHLLPIESCLVLSGLAGEPECLVQLILPVLLMF